MALTVTSRGTGSNNTGATTLVPGGRTATFAVGSMGVLCIALDNAGAAGGAVASPATWTDAKGNVWTRRTNALYDNGAASAGIEMVFYTAPITVALLTGDAGTISWVSGVTVAAKAWTWYEAIPGAGAKVEYGTGGNIAGATAANAQVITGTIAVGNAVIAGYFAEGVSAVTGDADATNGTWTAQQTVTVGATTSGVRIATQQKVQTTTPSTQSYDVTVASQDRIAGYITLVEAPNITGTGAGTGQASTGSGAAKETFAATGTGTGTASTGSGAAKETFAASGAGTGTASTASGTGTVEQGFSGTGAGVQAAATATGSGAEAFRATGTGTQAAATSSGTGEQGFAAAGAGVQSPAMGSGTGQLYYIGSGAAIQVPASGAGTGATGGAIVGFGAGVGAAPTGSGTGTVSDPAFSGTGAGIGVPPTALGTMLLRFTGTGAGTGEAPSGLGYNYSRGLPAFIVAAVTEGPYDGAGVVPTGTTGTVTSIRGATGSVSE